MTDNACSAGIDTGFAALSHAQVALLGVVQGVTELLPISSTAHMRVVPALLGWPDPGSAFSALMQLAALGAVVAYFRRDLGLLVGGSAIALRGRYWGDPSLRLAIGIGVGTVPIVVAGALLSPVLNACGSPLRSLWVIGLASLVMAALLALTEIMASHRRDGAEAHLTDMTLVGLAQAGALIPGVSRSGSTLTAALALGFRRADAARLSFLLGLPAIALAGLKELWVLANAGLTSAVWGQLALGLAVASLAAFAAIWFLMAVLERFSSWPFVIYRAIMGAGLLAAVATGWL